MNKTSFKSATSSSSQYIQKTNNSTNIHSTSHNNKEFKDFEEDSDFFEDSNSHQQGKIVHQSKEHSVDKKGNKITKTKIIREIDDISPKNSNSDIKMTKNKKDNKTKKFSKIQNEVERQKAIYKSPDFQNISSDESPLYSNNIKESKNYKEVGYKTNYKYQSKKIKGKNVKTYTTKEKYEYFNKNGKGLSRYEKSSQESPNMIGNEIISPVGYVEDDSFESDNDENQMKSFENFQYSIKTNNTNDFSNSNIINNKYHKKEKKKSKLNYEFEDPEGFDYLTINQRRISNASNELKKSEYNNKSFIKNRIDDSSRSDIRDFQSPDRNINEIKKFRKVKMGMIYSKGPTNDDNKVTKVMTKEVIETNKSTKNFQNYKYYNKDPKIRAKAAKIIQAWWRRKYNKEEEIYDITVNNAIKIQSHIRSFLVRKKVLRYITLAIYYQSFCDKLQDVLCSNVKRHLFKSFKDKYLSKKTNIIHEKKKIKKNPKENKYRRRIQLLKSIIKQYIEKKELYFLQILRRWKTIAYKIKLTEKKNKIKGISKTNTEKDFKTSINSYISKQQDINKYTNSSLKETKVKILKKSITANTSFKTYKRKTIEKNNKLEFKNSEYPLNLTSSKIQIKSNISNIPGTCICIKKSRLAQNTNYPSVIYSNSKKIYKYDKNKIKNNNYYNSINNSINNSLDKSVKKTRREKIRYTTSKERRNFKRFERVEKTREIIENEGSISPKFGALRHVNSTKKIIINNNKDNNINTNKINNEIKTVSNCKINTNNYKLNNSTETNIKKTKKIIRNIKAKSTITENNLNNNMTLYNNRKNKNQIISSGSLSILKFPNTHNIKRRHSFSEYKRNTKSVEKYKSKSEFQTFNNIDNQLSINILKLPEIEKQKLNHSMVAEDYQKAYEGGEPKVIERIRQKIIIQKEYPPETAEEGNDMQIFDMKICKGSSLFIKPSSELRKIIKEENKEIEIFKKREREKNKQIDKYKKDIEKQKQKSKLDALKVAIRIVESLKKIILQKKFIQYKNNCFSKPCILMKEDTIDIEIINYPKKKRDFSCQITSKNKEKENIVKNIIKKESSNNFKILKIFKSIPFSYEPQEKKRKKSESYEHKITKTKFNILSNIRKIDAGLQMDPWHTEIDYLENKVAYEYSKPKTLEIGSQYIQAKNIKGKTEQIQIIGNRPKMVDDFIQPDYPKNYIEKKSIEIKGTKPIINKKKKEPKISTQNKFSIISKKKKKIKKVAETCETASNTFVKTENKGINAIEKIKLKPKNIEVKIRTVRRSVTKFELPILKKIWLRKAFKTFRNNCHRPLFHKILEKEFLRMALLKWRFIKGYGPDRYGNAYDRDGNLLYKIRGKVKDSEVQNVFKVEQEEEGTQYVPIKNLIKTLEKFEISPAYKKQAKKITKDASVGDNKIIEEAIRKEESFNILTKCKKNKNKISQNGSFKILKIDKKLKDAQTQMIIHKNEIDKIDEFNIINEEFISGKKKINERIKELLIQIIYRKTIVDKLNLSESLRKWLKYTLIEMHLEENELEELRRRDTKIKKNDRFSLIEKIEKEDVGTQMNIKTYKNKIDSILNISLVNSIKKKNKEINVDIPNHFDLNNIKSQKQNSIAYKSHKKPMVLKEEKGNSMNIYSKDYIFREEIKRGIHHPMTEESIEKVTEILYKFIRKRGEPMSFLRKYFSIWFRKANYLSLLYNARIITQFCRSHLNKALGIKNWKKMSEKLLLREKIKIIRKSKEIFYIRKKIFDLIRLTRINIVHSKRSYLHYILISWLLYTRNNGRKRLHVKTLYERMLTTYMNMANDVFGSNQKGNPSVQDALFEVVDSNKFQTNNLQDVPIAKEFYENKKEFTKITNSIANFVKEDNKKKDNDIEIKEYSTYKSIKNKYSNMVNNSEYRKYKENNKNENNKEKIKIIKYEEKLNSRGRGRAFRTKIENEIINKYNSSRDKIYGKIKRLKINEDMDITENEINNNLTSRNTKKDIIYFNKKKINNDNDRDENNKSFFNDI